ncbi:MAG: methionyl-tRNA formyltransferase [Armatimonadota bacterium]
MGELTPIPQDNSQSSYAPSVKREECRIDWANNAETVVNRVRGCTPRPGAYTRWQSAYLKIIACRIADPDRCAGIPGEIIGITSDGIEIQTGSGTVLITEVQPENRNRIQASEFTRGYRINAGMRLESLDM